MKYEKLGTEIGRTVDKKQTAYGNSFGKSGAVLKIMYPDGVKIDQYDDMLAVVRIIDKLFRIATDKNALDENPFKDIAGYGLLGTEGGAGQGEPTSTPKTAKCEAECKSNCANTANQSEGRCKFTSAIDSNSQCVLKKGHGGYHQIIHPSTLTTHFERNH